jgi:predicted phosphate transport protein (TIGR00153 family)
MNLLPREEKFFSYFDRQSALIVEAAQELNDAVHIGAPALEAAAKKITALEQQADEVIHEAFVRLNTTFITPLDPEDIHQLASHLDDVIDGIEEASHRLVAYEVRTIPEPVKAVCAVILQCGQSLQRAFQALSKGEPLQDQCIRINQLEGEADQIVRKAVAELFRTETNPIELIKLKEVYEILEKTTDYAEDVADILQEVLVKNS